MPTLEERARQQAICSAEYFDRADDDEFIANCTEDLLREFRAVEREALERAAAAVNECRIVTNTNHVEVITFNSALDEADNRLSALIDEAGNGSKE